mmetsp:Transcript_23846/g.47456  ORF Transcript_23846/g.47456 Transcript_23846/m.47456 type:complete len:294 (-) Transcript_23846:691-1572(-)
MAASTISSSLALIQSLDAPACALQGAKTRESIVESSSEYSAQHTLMSAYTLRRGLLEKQRPSTALSFVENHSWRLITGMPSSSSSCLKYGMCDQASGTILLKTSTGIADTNSSATTFVPSLMSRWQTRPSSPATIAETGDPRRTEPPLASMDERRGAHSLEGWLPSRKAVCDPSASFMNLFIAVRITVMLSLSGSTKSRALPIAMKSSVRTLEGMLYSSMNSDTDFSSWRSMKSWPSRSMGRRPGTIATLSRRESMSLLPRIAAAMFRGAGTLGGKSKLVNRPGYCCIAKVMR